MSFGSQISRRARLANDPDPTAPLSVVHEPSAVLSSPSSPPRAADPHSPNRRVANERSRETRAWSSLSRWFRSPRAEREPSDPSLPGYHSNSLHSLQSQGLIRSQSQLHRVKTVANTVRATADQYWQEKLFMVTEYLQMFSVIYALTITRWGWPIWWKVKVKWVVIFNMDFWTLLDGQPGVTYHKYVFIWCFVPIILGLFLALWYQFYPDHENVDDQVIKSVGPRLTFGAGRLLLMPYMLSVLRLLECDDGRLRVEPSSHCYLHSVGFIHIFALFISTFSLIGLLYPFVKTALKVWSFSSSQRYEDFLISKEIELHLKLSHSWASHQYYLISSYSHRWIIYPVLDILLRTAFILLLCVIHGRQTQSIIAFIIAFVHFISSIFPYRCMSSNFVSIFMNGTIVAYIVFGAFLTAEIQSPYLLVPLSTKILTAIHIVGVLLGACSVFVARYLGGGWPIPLRQVEKYERRNRAMIRTLQEGMVMAQSLGSGRFMFVDPEHLNSLINRLSHYGENSNSYLSPLINEVWFQLNSKYSEVKPMKDLPYQNFVLSMTYEPLKGIMGDFVARINDRDFDLLLMDKRMKRILLKLYAVRAFINGRKLSYLDLNNPAVIRSLASGTPEAPNSKPQSRLLEKSKRVRIVDDDSDGSTPSDSEMHEIEHNIESYMDSIDAVLGASARDRNAMSVMNADVDTYDTAIAPGDYVAASLSPTPSFRTPGYLLVTAKSRSSRGETG